MRFFKIFFRGLGTIVIAEVAFPVTSESSLAGLIAFLLTTGCRR